MPMIHKCTWLWSDQWDDISSSIEACIEHIAIWINSDMLKLNKDNKKFIVFSSKQHVKKSEDLSIKVGSSDINYSMSEINLGLILDNTLGMEKQVNTICKSCYYQIRNIGLIRKYINDETSKPLLFPVWNIAMHCYIISPYLSCTQRNEHITPVLFQQRNIYTSENAPNWVLLSFEYTKRPHSNERREILSNTSY